MSRVPDDPTSEPDPFEGIASGFEGITSAIEGMASASAESNTVAESIAAAFAEFARKLAPPKPPLELKGVADRNVASQERIWLQANAHVRLNEYVMIVGVALEGDKILPLNDHVFWFGDHAVDSGTWVVVYTGAGQTRVTTDQHTGKAVLVLHWGREGTIFTIDALVPMLIRPVREQSQIGPRGA